jgi:Amt family ammonium transporter
MLGVVALQWLVLGHALAFGRSALGGLIGLPEGSPLAFGFGSLADAQADVPQPLLLTFELTVAAFAAALITGAAAERVKFLSMAAFAAGWTTLVYDPIAHWVWGPVGWLRVAGVHDFAGGLVVHVTAGASALGCAMMLGKRRGLETENFQPHSLTLTAIGAALLWFGWLGLNVGRARGFGPSTTAAVTSTIFGGAAGLVCWSAIEQLQKGKTTLLGACTGAVAGLVGTTPAAGFVTPGAAAMIALVASAASYGAVAARRRLPCDDALDVFAVHGVGGAVGVVGLGLLADPTIDGRVVGLFQGNAELIVAQSLGVVAVAVYAFVVTIGLWAVVDRATGLRVGPEEEELGLDLAQHGQRGYRLEGERLGA